jgi:hypothetical protein
MEAHHTTFANTDPGPLSENDSYHLQVCLLIRPFRSELNVADVCRLLHCYLTGLASLCCLRSLGSIAHSTHRCLWI